MLDQLRIGKKASHDDFDASLKERRIHKPKKKIIRETVPFFSGSYDFSKINGELYWEDRTLEYIFEIIAPTPEELEEKKAAFSDWIMNVLEDELHDPYIPNYRFIATYDDMSDEDDESVEKTTISVTFSAYPYKIANDLTMYSFEIPAGTEIQKTVVNNSSHRITPKINAETELKIQLGDDINPYIIPPGEVEDENFKIESGATVLTITNETETDCTLNIEFYAEVF